MKLFALLLSLALLLCACTPQEPVQTGSRPDTTVPSESANATESPDSTTPPTQPATEAMSALLLPDAWLITDATPLPYEEYFGQDRVYASNSTSWLVQTDAGYVVYDARLKEGKLLICTDAAEGAWLIPCQNDLSQYTLLSANGSFAYLRGRQDILAVNLLTGHTHTLLQTEGAYDARMQDNLVLYYTQTEGDSIKLCRKYIPTGEKAILYTVALEGTPESWFYFHTPDSTRGNIVWRMMNPEMLALLQQEFGNPDSKYRSEHPQFWDDPTHLNDPISASIGRICTGIQDETGTRAFAEYTYDPENGSITKKTGIIDSCWYGSGWAHDHFAPEITTLPEPTLLMEDWTTIAPAASRPTSPTAEELYVEDGYDTSEHHPVLYKNNSNLFVLQDGIATPIWDKPVISALNSRYYIYCIADDNTAYQISHDGSYVQPLYTGKASLSKLCYHGGRLCLLDGTTVVEIDVAKLQYRAVLEHPQVKRIFFFGDTGTPLRIEIYAGLREIDYHYYPATGQLVAHHPIL